MSRERMISPSLWTSWHFKGHPMGMKILFAALLHEADNHGRYQPEPERLCSLYFPHDSVSPEDIAGWLHILDESRDSTGVGPIRLYEVDGLQYLDIPKFHAPHHQALQYPSRPKYPMHPDGPYTEKARRWALEKGERLPAGLPEPKDRPRKHARAAAKRGLQGPEAEKAKAKRAGAVKRFWEWWLFLAADCGLPIPSKLTKGREQRIAARCGELRKRHDSERDPLGAGLTALGGIISAADYLCGRTKQGFRADIDFVIRGPDTPKGGVLQILEGKYSNKTPGVTKGGSEYLGPPNGKGHPDEAARERMEKIEAELGEALEKGGS